MKICRYFAVIKPMKLAGIDRRGKVMLCIAWIGSFVCSTPQAIIFHVETHPNITYYEQCVTYGFFKYEYQEIIYSFLGMIVMYALPLIIIIFCYASIYIELYKKSRKCVTGMRELTFLTHSFAQMKLIFNVCFFFFVFFFCFVRRSISSIK